MFNFKNAYHFFNFPASTTCAGSGPRFRGMAPDMNKFRILGSTTRRCKAKWGRESTAVEGAERGQLGSLRHRPRHIGACERVICLRSPAGCLGPRVRLERSAGPLLHRDWAEHATATQGSPLPNHPPPLLQELACRSMATPGPVGVAPGPKAYTASVPVHLLYLCFP